MHSTKETCAAHGRDHTPVRNTYEKALVGRDTGYNKICWKCAKRFGGPVYGIREIAIVDCGGHKKDEITADIERVKRAAQAVDPPKKRYTHKRKKSVVDKRFKANKAAHRPSAGPAEIHHVVGIDTAETQIIGPPVI